MLTLAVEFKTNDIYTSISIQNLNQMKNQLDGLIEEYVSYVNTLSSAIIIPNQIMTEPKTCSF